MKYLFAFWMLLAAPLALAATPVITAQATTAKGEVPLQLELVTEPQTRARGLMERTRLAPNDGMVFVFPTPIRRAFWMKNTPLPLDILFLDAKGNVVHIARNTTPYSEAAIDSMHPTLAAIELQAGQAAAKGIAEGDVVRYTLPAGTHVE